MFLKKWRNIIELKKYHWKFVAVKNLLLSTIWALTFYEQQETFFGVLVKLCFAKVLKRFNNKIKFSKKQISVLSSVSWVFERLMQKQIVSYLNKFLLLYICGTEQAFYFTIETWRIYLDSKGYSRAFLMDLSNGFDTIDYINALGKFYSVTLQIS